MQCSWPISMAQSKCPDFALRRNGLAHAATAWHASRWGSSHGRRRCTKQPHVCSRPVRRCGSLFVGFNDISPGANSVGLDLAGVKVAHRRLPSTECTSLKHVADLGRTARPTDTRTRNTPVPSLLHAQRHPSTFTVASRKRSMCLSGSSRHLRHASWHDGVQPRQDV